MSIENVKFIPSRWFTKTSGRAIDLLVLHTTEGDPDNPGGADDAAENTALYCARRNDKVSAHWFVDDDTMVRGVLDKDVAYAAPGANHDGIQIEMCGYAKWTTAQWKSEHLGTLCQVSRLLGHYHNKLAIPLEFISEAGLKRGEKGVTTHYEVTKVFRRSTHTDPGPGFPIGDVLDLARHFAAHPGE